MIFIDNKTNLSLIRDYVNTDSAYDMIQTEVDLTSVLASYSPSVASGVFKNNCFPIEVFIPFMLSKGKNTNAQPIRTEIKSILIRKLTYHSKNDGSLKVNTTATANFVRKLFRICLIQQTNKLLIYNTARGYWHEYLTILERFIYELVSTTLNLKWTIALQDAVLREVNKKVPIVNNNDLNVKGFPFRNVTLDYTTNKIVHHNPKHYSTIHSDVTYDPNAKCPVFMGNMNIWFAGDPQTQLFVQEWFGYVLSGSFKANAFLLVYSEGGEGKSTLFGILEKLIGGVNTTSTPLSNLNTQFGLEPLVGKKLNLSTENSNGAFDTAKLKAITAGEKITVNRKNIPECEMVLPIKMIYLLNDLPTITDKSVGFARRLIILPFLNKIPVSKQDKNLSKKLNYEMSGILNWALNGLNRLENNGYNFTISSSMQKIRNRYLSEEDVMTKFIKSKIQVCPGNSEYCSDVIDSFESWTMLHGYTVAFTSQKSFWKAFEPIALTLGIPYDRYRKSGYSALKGIKIV